MKTKLTELLGIKYPIIQGGMAWISEATLVSAVSNAGGAGIIGTGGRETEWVRNEIRKTKELTSKPFGVNIVLMAPNKEEIIDVVCEEKINFVTLGAGNPVPHFKKLQANGVKAIPVVPNTKLAKRVENEGADAIVVEGMEAGGHIGTLSTMALLTNIIPELSIPVIAAGGISDGRGIAAALLMGASGVQMGSRFLLTTECVLHPKIKEKIMEAIDTDSVVTGYSRGHAVRGLRNNFTEEFARMERSGAKDEELQKFATGRNRMSAVLGDFENGSVQVGQSLNVLNEIKTTTKIIQELMNQTINALNKAAKLVD